MENSFSAYDAARTFSNAFTILLDQHLLARKTGNYENFSLIMPAMVNGALASELFLKSLLPTSVHGHKLFSELYSKLDASTAREIEIVVIEVARNKNIELTPEKFLDELKRTENIFVEFRYWHEPQKNGGAEVYSIDFIELLTISLKAICEQRFGKRPISQ